MPDHARIAIIGTGWWSSTAHFPALAAHPAAQITAICDTREEVLTTMAEKFGVDKTYTDYRELLANEELDGAVVAVGVGVRVGDGGETVGVGDAVAAASGG